ncbi:MAG: hypothetical protein ACOCQ2_00845 [Halanaerobiales bacterium]
MNKKEKISEILNFINLYPASTASLTIIRKHTDYPYHPENINFDKNKVYFNLKQHLETENKEEIDFCYYLIK